MQTIRKAQRREAFKTFGGAVLLFWVAFTLFSSVRSQFPFMDEMDNFYIGLQMTKGSVLYDTIFSQHMPLMYYINALFARLGAHTVLEFRLSWYVFLALCYVALYLRYARRYGRVAMLAWPVLYLLACTNVELCMSVLAEQLQAIGTVMLALEFFHFTKTRTVSVGSAVCIAVGINISFLSAFVAAFACAGVVLGFVGLELRDCVRRKLSFPAAVAYLWRKYRLTIALTLLPMVAFAAYFVAIGNFDDFIYKAYTLNREIYSKYQNGFGESPLQALWGCVTAAVLFAKQVFQTLFQGARLVPGAVILLAGAYWAAMGYLLLHRRFWAGVALSVLFLLCGVRGYYNFHSLQTFALSAVAAALFLGACWRAVRTVPAAAKRARAVRVCAGVLGLAFCGLYLSVSGGFVWAMRTNLYPKAREFSPVYEAHSTEALVNALTEPREYILENINKEELFLETHARAPVYNTACSPWWWEGTKERSMREIRANPPRVAIFDEDYTVWGHVVKDFAPEMTAFVHENYTQLYDDAPTLLVHNDYLEEARAKLPADDSSMVHCAQADTTCGEALSGEGIVQSFVATREKINSISVQFGTHSVPYTGEVTAVLARADTGETVAQYALQGKDIVDNAFTLLHTPEEPPLAVEKGVRYALTLTARHKRDDNITVWASEGDADATSYASIGGVPQTYHLRIKVR